MLLLFIAAQAASTATCPDGRPVQGQQWSCARSIYFDSGEGSEIRTEWTSVLDQVAAEQRQRGGRVQLDSFADRSGTIGANLRVSADRGAAIRQALVRRGVPATAIVSRVHGEQGLMVPTPDGVREPQNRRVDITLLP